MTTASPTSAPKSKLRFVTLVARILMALIFLPAGAMYFLNMMPEPNPPPPAALMDFAAAMMKTGYLFQLVKGVELITGVLFLINRFVPLALVVNAPVAVNICLVNFLVGPTPAGIGTCVFIIVLWFYLAWAYRAAFRPMLAAKVAPTY